MKICDDPSDPVKVKQTIAEVEKFCAGREIIPFTMDKIKAIGTPAPKRIAQVSVPKVPCEKREGA